MSKNSKKNADAQKKAVVQPTKKSIENNKRIEELNNNSSLKIQYTA